MPLPEYLAALDALAHDAEQAFAAASNEDAVEAARVEFLGAKNGRMKSAQKGLGTVAASEKPAAGKRFHEVKGIVEGAFEAAKNRLGAITIQLPSIKLTPRFGSPKVVITPNNPIDVTLPGKRLRLGKLHPITQTIEELKDIMGRLGFTPHEGPEIEDEWHNFQALNIPREHPSRDPLENFYLSTAAVAVTSEGNSGGPLLLRSQTSTVQIRVMETMQPPIRIISLGRVYRPDDVDETHYPMFHQMEGLLIDRHVTMADLKSVLRLFAQTYLGRDVQVRFRPSFFPFTEPSVEVDMRWGDRWMEFGGAGMVDPNVLRAVGYDPEQVTGFAFGLGVERLCMRRHHITDIRELFKNDVRFLQQF